MNESRDKFKKGDGWEWIKIKWKSTIPPFHSK